MALLAVSCGSGVTLDADGITDVGMDLNGEVHNTITGTTSWWFEYGPTTDYGSTTPVKTVHVSDTSVGKPVTARIDGLTDGTTVHFRLCATDVNGHGPCGGDREATTSDGVDSVTGRGTVFTDGSLGFAYGGEIFATSDPGGADPTGEGWVLPGDDYFRITDEGPVTCLRVEGNRAAVGILGDNSDYGADVLRPRLIFIEDNGASGDRFSLESALEPYETCPVPTSADFVGGSYGGFPFGSTVSSGDFVVHDHAG